MPAPASRSRETARSPPPLVILLAAVTFLTIGIASVISQEQKQDVVTPARPAPENGTSASRDQASGSKAPATSGNPSSEKVLSDFETKGFEFVSSSTPSATDSWKQDDRDTSKDLPATNKQYDYPLLRPAGPLFSPFLARPSLSSWSYADHNKSPYPPAKPSPGHVVGNPMISTVVVQDMTNTLPARPPHGKPPPGVDFGSGGAVSSVDNIHHLGTNKIPFTGISLSSKPLSGNRPGPTLTDKLEESDLADNGAHISEEEDVDEDEETEETGDDDDVSILENPPALDMGGIVEDALKSVFEDNKKVLKSENGPNLHEASDIKPWECPPVSCCVKTQGKQPARRCSTVTKCGTGKTAECPKGQATWYHPRPHALALSTPAAASDPTNSTVPGADVRDGEPRFKKKKILKKKKKFLKKFLLPLLLAYKLLFLLMVPLLVHGMMMMMSSSGMAGFFFALIGASVAMVRVYTGSTKIVSHPPQPPHPPQPNKVIKVIKYVQPPAPPTPAPTPPPPPPAPPPPTIIHHQPFIEEHFPSYPMSSHVPSYGSYWPPPHMPHGYYDRSENYDRHVGNIDISKFPLPNGDGIFKNAETSKVPFNNGGDIFSGGKKKRRKDTYKDVAFEEDLTPEYWINQ